MNYIDYITGSLAKGSIGAFLSVGLYGLVAIFAVSGLIFGLIRGFSKSVIRLFTIVLSAVGAVVAVIGISNVIVNLTNAPDATSLEALILKYIPSAESFLPSQIRPLLAEMGAETSVFFFMMIVCLFIAPGLFLAFFFLLKGATFFIYKLLSGLVGAVSYGKGIVSTITGGLVGLIQGVIIGAIVIIPIGGVCGIAAEARTTLVDNNDSANGTIVSIYENVLDDMVDNPLFDTINTYGGEAAFGKITTVTVGGASYDMSKESIVVLHLFSDAAPLISGSYEWKDPTPEHLNAYYNIIDRIGENRLIAAFGADILRGCAKCIDQGDIKLSDDGANAQLLEDVIGMFSTSTEDTIQEDLRLVVDIYHIMCDHALLVAFDNGDENVLIELLTEKDENDDTIIEIIIDRLNSYDRSKPIVRSFTKISLSLMHVSMGVGGDTTELYESVKENMHDVLSHNKSDFETEEEYKEAVKSDLDAALAENDLDIDEETKKNMVDYIAENYGDKEDISDEDIDDAILSYYASYASSKENK